MIEKNIIKIELQSDLCAGSGYSYAGIVDSDVCYDDCGIPYIPSKRLKGCMRETLELLNLVGYNADIEALFGKTGVSDYESGIDKKIRIGNAYIENYEEIYSTIKKSISKGEINAQEILERFTHVVGQTAMENGVANDQTLRYTRVVNRYYPFIDGDSKPLIFKAKISLDDSSSVVIKDTLTALTHIGLKRNRGFGYVKCTLENEVDEDNISYESFLSVDNESNRITFALKNIEPLMLSGTKEDVSSDYISAQSVIGLLAGRYLKKNGNSPEDKEFKDLFINGNTKYTNLYPCKNNEIHYPAPDYLEKLKKNGTLVFHLEDALPDRQEITPKFDYGNGNLPKKLKGKYVSRNVCEVSLAEVEKEIIYHHRQGDDSILYSSTAISPNQFFAGSIEASNVEYLNKIKDLLLDGDFYFGKSRTSQYGLCRLTDFSNIKNCENQGVISKGNRVLVTFLSDAIFINDNGEYTVYSDEVEKIISKELGLSNLISSSYQTTLVTGFYGKWNLRKAPIPAIRAGSFMLFENDKEYKPSCFTIGEKTMEGYGRISIENASELKYEGVVVKNVEEKKASSDVQEKNNLALDILFPILANKWVEEKINEYLEQDLFKLSSSNSSVGRMKLMLMESQSDSEPLLSFSNRIESIKSEYTRDEGRKLVEAANDFIESAKSKYAELTGADMGKRIGMPSSDNADGDKLCKYLQSKWPEYIMGIITIRKYTGGGK